MANEHFQVVSVAPERKYTKVYHDFLYSDLTTEEKLVYIALKTFVEFGKDGDSVWPTMETLGKITSMSVPRSRRAIDKLVAKGYIKKKRRGLQQSNIYELCDVAEIWKSDTPGEVMETQSEVVTLSDEVLLAELERRGYTTTKKEGLDSAATDQSPEVSLENTSSEIKGIKIPPIRQAEERYSMEEIQSHFGYEAVAAAAADKEDVDVLFSILFDVMNSTKKSLRVGGEVLPKEVVLSRLMKLDYSDLLFVINQYNAQTERITNQTAYILTQLYRAKAQNHLNLKNEGHVNGDF